MTHDNGLKNDSLGTSKTRRVAYSVKIGLMVIGFVLFIGSAMVFAQPVDKFVVNFDVEPGLDHVCLYMDIMNNQLLDDIFPFKTILSDTSVNTDKTTTRLWEYQYVSHDVNRCNDCTKKDCWPDNITAGRSAGCRDVSITDCDSCGETVVQISEWEWVEQSLMHQNRYVSKERVDNRFDQVDIKKTETKRYKLCYYFNEIPETWGSRGTISIDINDKIYFDLTNSSWWNISFGFRYPIDTNATTSLSFNVNDTFNPDLWTNNVTGGMFVYCTISGCESGLVAIANETSELHWENGTLRTGNEPTLVYDKDNHAVLHFDSGDLGFAYDSSRYNNSATLVSNPGSSTDFIFGPFSLMTDGATDYAEIPSIETIGTGTVAFWLNYANGTGHIASLGDTWVIGSLAWAFVGASGGSNTITMRLFDPSIGTPACDALSTAVFVPNQWHLVVGSWNQTTCRIYGNGTLLKETLNISQYKTGSFKLRIGASTQPLYTGGNFDEFRFYNRTLNATEINELYRNGINSLAPTGAEEISTAVPNTSIFGTNFTIPDFSFSSSTFVTLINVSFNTSVNSRYAALSSMNIEKLTGGGTNVISTRIIIDGNIALEEQLRSVMGIADIGSSGTSPLLFNLSVGQHSIACQFSRTGIGDVGISNIDFTLLDMVSSDSKIIRAEQVNLSYSHSSLSFVPAFNWTINKSINSSTVIITKQTVDKMLGGNSVAAYKYLDVLNNDESPFWSRLISGVGDVGSLSSTFIQEDVEPSHGWSILSSQSNPGDTVNVNGTLIDFDMVDSDDNRIPNFQTTNDQTNETQSINLTAGTHLLATENITLRVGDQYFLSMSTTFSSLSGTQTPTYFINSTGNTTCRSEKERYLSSNTDIGNAFIYFICDNLTVNENHIFNLYVIVETGETLTQIDESLNGFESTALDITTTNVPPIANDITNPLNETNVTGIDTITWLAFFDPNFDLVTYNITLGNSDGTFNFTIGTTINLSIPVFWNDFQDGIYTLTVTGSDPFGLSSNTTITIQVFTIPPPPTFNISFIFNIGDTLPVSDQFCVGNNLITVRERESCEVGTGACSTINQTDPTFCRFGCTNESLSNWGLPGCVESDLWIAIIFIIFIIILVLLIRKGN